jgi:hypothetical protein
VYKKLVIALFFMFSYSIVSAQEVKLNGYELVWMVSETQSENVLQRITVCVDSGGIVLIKQNEPGLGEMRALKIYCYHKMRGR